MSSAPDPAVTFCGVTKRFAGQLAVDNVTFDVLPGEIHALVGENGAGKSTLIKILAGVHRPDSGEILLDGQSLVSTYPGDSIAAGVAVVHQDPALVPHMSVVENLGLGLAAPRAWGGQISWKRQTEIAQRLLDRVGLGDLDPHRLLETLSPHHRQLVALARAIRQGPKVIVLDEVTAPLGEAEVLRLFDVVRGLRAEGTATLYVSHRLSEVSDLCDRVTIMRSGRHVATRPVDGLDVESLTTLIIGHESAGVTERERGAPVRPVVLEAVSITAGPVADVNLTVRAGEVLGIAGLAGAGRSGLLKALSGSVPVKSGSLLFKGAPTHFRHPADAIAVGIAMVSEDRKSSGYIAELSVAENIVLPSLRSLRRWRLVSRKRWWPFAVAAAAAADVRAASLDMAITQLSGGNQQKALLARWMSRPLAALLLDEPTHGVDVGARAEIYHQIRALADGGLAIVVVASDLDELASVCDRALLLREGRVIGELSGTELTRTVMLSRLFKRDNTQVA